MRDSFFLAGRYLKYHWATSIVLITSVALILFLPAALLLVVDQASSHFRARAADTPLVVGARGSSLELVLGSLYFDQLQPDQIRMEQVARIEAMELGNAIPLNVVTRVGKTPVIGTTGAYYKLRDLRLSEGRGIELMGECLVGAQAARILRLQIGSRVAVSSNQVFALRDAPLRLNVVGILAATETADDEAIFVNVKTTWLIAGFGHGHAAGAKHGSEAAVEYTDITPDNAAGFHFHTDSNRLPITSVIVIPNSRQSETLILGDYLSPEETVQAVRPTKVMNALLERVVMVRSYILSATGIVSLVTIGLMLLVLALSIQLRHGELTTMRRMGCSNGKIGGILAAQMCIVVSIGFCMAAILTITVSAFAHQILRLAIT